MTREDEIKEIKIAAIKDLTSQGILPRDIVKLASMTKIALSPAATIGIAGVTSGTSSQVVGQGIGIGKELSAFGILTALAAGAALGVVGGAGAHAVFGTSKHDVQEKEKLDVIAESENKIDRLKARIKARQGSKKDKQKRTRKTEYSSFQGGENFAY